VIDGDDPQRLRKVVCTGVVHILLFYGVCELRNEFIGKRLW
jgi:hypothetical protein